MFSGGDDDEQDFLSPSGGSQLASVFGLDKATSLGGNESLTYTAPKEPKKKLEPASGAGTEQGASGSPQVLSAAPVFAYKFVDGKFDSQGKLGAAVVGNHDTQDYKILLYVTKDKQIAVAKISTTFQFAIQPSNYATFYDDSRQSWSVMFDSESVLIQFAKQVALSKALSAKPKLDSLISQDICLGEGSALEAGDSVEIKYSGWLLESCTFGTMFETNGTADKLFRLRIGKGKAMKAWDDGVLGMKKNGRRLLVSPPHLAYGSEGKPNKVPLSAVVIFELEIVRVKFGRERGPGETGQGSESTTAQSTVDVDGRGVADESGGVKARTKSISDQLNPPQTVKTDKAKLISRMATLGQPMLPMMTQPPPVESPDQENPASQASNAKPSVPSKPVQQGGTFQPPGGAFQPPVGSATQAHLFSAPQHTLQDPSFATPNMFAQPHSAAMFQGVSNSMAVYQPQAPLMFQPAMGGYSYGSMQGAGYGGVPPQLPGYNSQIFQTQPPPAPVQAAAPAGAPDANLSMMLIETRQQNTEVRVSLSKVADKMDRMSEKLDALHGQQTGALMAAQSMPSMEVGMLVQNIQRIVKENEQLRTDTMEKSAKIESLTSKIGELLQRNQLYIEQSNAMLEQRNDTFKSTATQSQVRVQTLEQEKVQMATELSAMTSQLSSCQLEVGGLRKVEGELRQQLDKLLAADSSNREELTTLRLQLNENKQLAEDSSTQLKSEKLQRKQLESKLEELQETLSELKLDKEVLEKNLTEKKKKSSEELARMESEIEELKSNFERELSELKNRLKSQKNTTELSTAQQAAQQEQELNREWEEKCNRLLTAAQEKHQRQVADLDGEKKALEEKVAALEGRIADLKAARLSGEERLEAMSEEVETLRSWKDRYDQLRAQASSMKERYEVRLREMEEERQTVEQGRLQRDLEHRQELNRAKQQSHLPTDAVGGGASSSADVSSKVKSIMSAVYRNLRLKFSDADVYEAPHILSTILDVIKTVTLEMIENSDSTVNSLVTRADNLTQNTASQLDSQPLNRNPEPVSESVPLSRDAQNAQNESLDSETSVDSTDDSKDDAVAASLKLSEVSTIEMRNETVSAERNEDDVPASKQDTSYQFDGAEIPKAAEKGEYDLANEKEDVDQSSSQEGPEVSQDPATNQDHPSSQERVVAVSLQENPTPTTDDGMALSREDHPALEGDVDPSINDIKEEPSRSHINESSVIDGLQPDQASGQVLKDSPSRVDDDSCQLEVNESPVRAVDESSTFDIPCQRTDDASCNLTNVDVQPGEENSSTSDTSNNSAVDTDITLATVEVPNDEPITGFSKEISASQTVEGRNNAEKDADTCSVNNSATALEKREESSDIPSENSVVESSAIPESTDFQQSASVVASGAGKENLFDSEEEDGWAIPALSQKPKPVQRSVFEAEDDDDDDLDIFRSSAAKPRSADQKVSSSKTDGQLKPSAKTPESSSAVKRVLSDEDLGKAPPPLLPFEDSGDENDLDWIK